MSSGGASSATSSSPSPPSGDGRRCAIPAELRPYAIVNSSYLLFTVTDGAVRMLVLLQAASIGFNVWDIALMFTLYEVAGVFTNLLAGLAGAKWGMKWTLIVGLVLQLGGFGMLLGWDESWPKATGIWYVTFAQMLCGIAKDLVKLPGKTVSKLVSKEKKQHEAAAASGAREADLFTLIVKITGYKNSFKGAGYFLGSLILLWEVGPNKLWGAIGVLVVLVLAALPWPIFSLPASLGRSDTKQSATLASTFCLEPGATEEAKQQHWNRNWLSLGRCFMFGARDCWFEVPLPLFFRTAIGWSRPATGAVLALYIIAYGQFQAHAEVFLRPLRHQDKATTPPLVVHKWHVVLWALLILIPQLWLGTVVHLRRRALFGLDGTPRDGNNGDAALMIGGICVFAFIFGINSAINSFLIGKYSSNNSASKNMGFYYMSNAAGRLLGTLTSGLIYSPGEVEGQHFAYCFWVACGCVLAVVLASLPLRDGGRLNCGASVGCCGPELRAPDEKRNNP